MKQFAASEALLRDAEKFGAQAWALAEYARAARVRADWQAARQRWAAFRAAFLADMATRFESLGGTLQGCEFGPVQRGFGAEPLGLLRWSSARLSGLVDCLNEDFAGVGTPEQTIVAFASARNSIKEGNGDPEYITRDRRFRFSGHTFIKKSQIPPDKMFKQSCRRITFIKRKMMEDLAEGSKVFVFKLGDRVLPDDEIDLLYHALRRYGNNTLLYVRHHDADHPSGTAELVKDGLILGYIDQFSMGEDNMPRQPNLPAWSAICERAWRLRFMSADAVSGFDVSAG